MKINICSVNVESTWEYQATFLYKQADQQISKCFAECETDKSNLNAMAEVNLLHSLHQNDKVAMINKKHMTGSLFFIYIGSSREANMLLPHSVLTPFW
jgi:hypothetical protein